METPGSNSPDGADSHGGIESAQSLLRDLEALGRHLQIAVRELVEPLTGHKPKPNDVGEVLKLDRTQAWRVSRMMSDECPYTVLYESPAPKGLRLIIEAALRAGTPERAATMARGTVSQYDEMLDRFPEGRAGLEGALSARVPKARDTMYRKARKQVSIGMSQLLGLRAGARYVAGILAPSEGLASKADVVAVAGYKDLRRLRVGPAPVVFSGRTSTQKPGPKDPALETLDGDLDPDPRLRLLDQLAPVPPEALRLERSGEELRLTLSPEFPPINNQLTVFFGQRIARSLERYRTTDRTHEVVHHAPVLPADVNIFDTIIHKSMFLRAQPPRLTIERFGFNPMIQSQKPDDASYRMDDHPDVVGLGSGIKRIGARVIPELGELIASVFERIGADPDDFLLYRTSVEHLPPGFAVTVWLPLDESNVDG